MNKSKNKLSSHSDEIERKANLLLETALDGIFEVTGDMTFKLFPLGRPEKGIDYKIEVEDSETRKTRYWFSIQNKGSMKELKPLIGKKHKNEIPLTLDDIRQVEYFCTELDEALVITYCDLSKRRIYWLPIQLFREQYINEVLKIKKEISLNKRHGKSIRVYFSKNKIIYKNNRLVANNIGKLLDDINASRAEVLSYRLNTGFGNITSEINKQLIGLAPTEAIAKIVEEFKCLKVIPEHIYTNLYPFAFKNSNAIHTNNALITYNENLIDELNAVSSYDDHYFIHKVGQSQRLLSAKENKLFATAVEFFKNHRIWHIEFQHTFNKRASIYRYFNEKRCNCSRCRFERCDYSGALKTLRKQIASQRFSAETGQMLTKTGQFKEAFNVYKALMLRSRNNIPNELLYKFLLSQLRFFVSRNFKEDEDIKDASRAIDPLSELTAKASLITKEVFEALKYVINGGFVQWRITTAKELVDDLRHIYYIDQWGGFSHHSKVDSLLSEIILMDAESEENGIYANDFADYQTMVSFLLEGYTLSYMTKSGISSRVSEFGSSVVAYIINNGHPDDLKRIFRDYHVDSIKYKVDDGPYELDEVGRLEYFSRSVTYLNEFLQDQAGLRNFHFEQKLNYIFQNTMIFLRYIELDDIGFNKCVERALKIISKATFLNERSYVLFNALLLSKHSKTTKQNWVKLVRIHEHTTNWMIKRNFHMSTVLRFSGSKKWNKYVNDVLAHYKIDLQKSPEVLLKIYSHCDQDQRDEIATTITEYLDRNFNMDLCHSAVVNDIIDFKRYRTSCFSYVKENRKGDQNVFIGMKTPANDSNLSAFINMCYHCNEDLSEYVELIGSSEYYKWLFNLHDFDYSKFNVYWIMEYDTSIYYNEFAKVKPLKKAVLEFIRIHAIEGIVAIYLKYFDNDN